MQLMPSPNKTEVITKGVIALKVFSAPTKSNGDRVYDIKFLDPSGPEVLNMECSKSRENIFQGVGVSPLQLRKTYCLHPKLGLVLPILDGSSKELTGALISKFNDKCNLETYGKICDERKNLSRWLELNYPSIKEEYPVSQIGNVGIYFGWTDFVMKSAYLADFVGECASTPTAEVPVNNLASTGLLSFFDLLFKDFLKPFINY
jgi:hypothetical protein